MPRAARFRIAAIEDLLRQLEYAPADTRRRHMDAAEALVDAIDPDRNYPQEFIVFRITGYRPERHDEPVTFVGEALRADLVTFIQVLSDSLELDLDARGGGMEMSEVARRLGVSLKSIQRYRRLGLVCHRIVQTDGSRRLMCFEDALERFVAANRPRIEKAAGFSRMEPELERAIIEQARRLRDGRRLTLNEAALELSKAHHRAHETVRQLLRRHDRRSGDPIFTERGPITEREAKLAHRAWRRGIDVADIAKPLGRSKSAALRAICKERASALRQVPLSHIELPTFGLPDAQEVILAADSVVRGLEPRLFHEPSAIILKFKQTVEPKESVQDSLLSAFNLLKRRAAGSIAALGATPNSAALDAIETDLRWAAMLHRRLIDVALPAALGRIEQFAGRPLAELPVELRHQRIRMAVLVASDAVAQVDPSRGQRLTRLASFAMDRELAKMPPARGSDNLRRAQPRQASPRAAGPAVPLPWFAAASWLWLRRDLMPHTSALEPLMREAITTRFGLEGERPLTIAMVADRMRMSPLQASRLVQRAVRRLREMARAAPE